MRVNRTCNGTFYRTMKHFTAVLVIASLTAGCGTPLKSARELGPATVVASPYEPAAQLDPQGRGSAAEGAVIGAAGGAGIGAMSAKASAGLLCTVGGPLCWVVMIPAAVVGGLIGGVVGGAADAITSAPGEKIVTARNAINQAVADMRLTDALAARMRARQASTSATHTLEVEMTEIAYLAREKDMALTLRGRARLYQASDGKLLDERVAEVRTPYRKYEEWAADGARPLREELDASVALLASRIAGGG